MSHTEIILPALGEGITDATLTRWLVKEGDKVTADQPVAEIATDKVDSEISAPAAGIIAKLLFAEGTVVAVGKTIALLTAEGQSIQASDLSKINSEKTIQTVAVTSVLEKAKENTNPSFPESSAGILSPLVKSIIRENNLSNAEVESIRGTGADGRLTKEDVLNWISRKTEVVSEQKTEYIVRSVDPVPYNIKPPQDNSFGDTEIIEMDRMRKLIADHMVQSVKTSPHVTSFSEADVTPIVEWREKHKDEFHKRHGVKLTFLPVFLEAVALALQDFPMVNVSVDGNTIIRKKYYNLGMATALPNGNLIVPVIKNADQKNLSGLARTIADLSGRARENKLLPDEIKGSTFTITNLGTFGTITGTPIINQPEAAILALGAIRKRPAVVATSTGDAIAIRHIMILALTFDHRVIDGALGGMFLQRVVEILEQFDSNRKF
jgi:2-oxoglutarate dehydrogenase E2 component (dihydrolipoamide succinyltransferase)